MPILVSISKAGLVSDIDNSTITAVLTRLRRFLRLRIRAEFPWETLPMAQVEFLQRLAEEPGLRINDLARKHFMAKNTVSALIQQMVEAGLVSRDPDPHDRRAVSVKLTERGESSLKAWMQGNELIVATALLQLDDEDRATIARAMPALGRLANSLDQA